MARPKNNENNFIGYLFGCSHGCQASSLMYKNGRIKKLQCPICGNTDAYKVWKCIECGKFFTRGIIGTPLRCYQCAADMKGFQDFKNHYGEPKKKPPFDQSRRGECKFGDECRDRQLMTGKRFNCHGCSRFEKLEFDIMDYVRGQSSLESANIYNVVPTQGRQVGRHAI